jgi:epsin
LKHLWEKINSNNKKEWRKIAKALHVMDYLVKNGAPRVIQDIKDDLYKIKVFKDFVYKESNGVEQGVELRDKANSLCDLVMDSSKL